MATDVKTKKTMVLGENPSTASGRLRKKILFSLLKELNKNYCFQCGLEIEDDSSLSIEHKTAWLNSNNGKELFWDLDNIAFSHLSCNCRAGEKVRKLSGEEDSRCTHGASGYTYRNCRCEICKNWKKNSNKINRK